MLTTVSIDLVVRKHDTDHACERTHFAKIAPQKELTYSEEGEVSACRVAKLFSNFH